MNECSIFKVYAWVILQSAARRPTRRCSRPLKSSAAERQTLAPSVGDLSGRPSRPGESHPEALTDPCLSLSAHTARAIHRELPLSATISRFLLLPVDQVDHDANGLPPSLHGNYPASSLLWGSPNLNSAFVRSPSWFCHLWLLR